MVGECVWTILLGLPVAVCQSLRSRERRYTHLLDHFSPGVPAPCARPWPMSVDLALVVFSGLVRTSRPRPYFSSERLLFGPVASLRGQRRGQCRPRRAEGLT